MGIFDKFKKTKPTAKAEKKASEKKLTAKEAKPAANVTTLKAKAEGEGLTAKKETVGKKAKRDDSVLVYKILVKPLITEKATTLVSLNKYAFQVAKTADKKDIKRAIKALYGFAPLDVNIINARGKRVTYGRIRGKKSNWKKAIVTMKAGDKLDIYEGV